MGLGNENGKLGDGTTNDKTSPVQITASNGSVTEFQSVSAGGYHSLAMDIEGNLWAWGHNYQGQIDENLDSKIKSPVMIELK